MSCPYKAILQHLNDNHIYPTQRIKDGVIVGLEVHTPPILRDMRLAYLKKVLPEGFKFTAFTNDQEYILITKKTKK